MRKYEEWEQKPWERSRGYGMSDRKSPWSKELMTRGYPEEGAGSVDVDELYEAFKERLMHELGLSGHTERGGNE